MPDKRKAVDEVPLQDDSSHSTNLAPSNSDQIHKKQRVTRPHNPNSPQPQPHSHKRESNNTTNPNNHKHNNKHNKRRSAPFFYSASLLPSTQLSKHADLQHICSSLWGKHHLKPYQDDQLIPPQSLDQFFPSFTKRPDKVAPSFNRLIETLNRSTRHDYNLDPALNSVPSPNHKSLDKHLYEYTLNPRAMKFFTQRYRLFSRFDFGCLLDTEGWYSVTPEIIASHLAHRILLHTPGLPKDPIVCETKEEYEATIKRWAGAPPIIIVDLFCGGGGNAIQFALARPTVTVELCEEPGLSRSDATTITLSTHILSAELDPIRALLAQHNARIYGVEKQISIFVGDCFKLIQLTHILPSVFKIPIASVFLSPPWGGVDYPTHYDINSAMPINGTSLLSHSRLLSDHIIYYLPKTINIHQCTMLQHVEPPTKCKGECLGHIDKCADSSDYLQYTITPTPAHSVSISNNPTSENSFESNPSVTLNAPLSTTYQTIHIISDPQQTTTSHFTRPIHQANRTDQNNIITATSQIPPRNSHVCQAHHIREFSPSSQSIQSHHLTRSSTNLTQPPHVDSLNDEYGIHTISLLFIRLYFLTLVLYPSCFPLDAVLAWSAALSKPSNKQQQQDGRLTQGSNSPSDQQRNVSDIVDNQEAKELPQEGQKPINSPNQDESDQVSEPLPPSPPTQQFSSNQKSIYDPAVLSTLPAEFRRKSLPIDSFYQFFDQIDFVALRSAIINDISQSSTHRTNSPTNPANAATGDINPPVNAIPAQISPQSQSVNDHDDFQSKSPSVQTQEEIVIKLKKLLFSITNPIPTSHFSQNSTHNPSSRPSDTPTSDGHSESSQPPMSMFHFLHQRYTRCFSGQLHFTPLILRVLKFIQQRDAQLPSTPSIPTPATSSSPPDPRTSNTINAILTFIPNNSLAADFYYFFRCDSVQAFSYLTQASVVHLMYHYLKSTQPYILTQLQFTDIPSHQLLTSAAPSEPNPHHQSNPYIINKLFDLVYSPPRSTNHPILSFLPQLNYFNRISELLFGFIIYPHIGLHPSIVPDHQFTRGAVAHKSIPHCQLPHIPLSQLTPTASTPAMDDGSSEQSLTCTVSTQPPKQLNANIVEFEAACFGTHHKAFNVYYSFKPTPKPQQLQP